MNMLGMSVSEFATAFAVFPLAAAVLGILRPSAWPALLLLFGAMQLSVSEASQFMTVDEIMISNQLLTVSDRAGSQWQSGALRTTLPFAIGIVRAGEALGFDDDFIRIILKLTWWGAGVVLVALAVRAWIDLVALTGVAEMVFSIVSLSLLSSPVVAAAQKTINYDLISLLLSVVAFAWILRAARSSNLRLMTMAVVAATLAAQEKLSASPVLYVVLGIATVLWYRRGANALRAFSCAFVPLAIAAGVVLVWFTAYRLVDDNPTFKFEPLAILDPLVTILWVPARFLADVNPVEHRITLALLLVVLIGATIIVAVVSRPARLLRLPGLGRIAGISALTLRLAPAGCIVMGLIGLATLQPYWAPYHPASEAVWNLAKFNGIVLHFGNDSLPAHYVSLLTYNFELMFVAIPTAVWILWLVTMALNPPRPHQEVELVDVAPALIWTLPLAATIFAVPVAHRYLNLSIVLLTLTMLTDIATFLSAAGATALARPVAVVAVIAVAIEAAPFAPLGTAFRPLWLNYRDDVASTGVLNPSWMGWGEEVMAGGKLLERECKAGRTPVPCDAIRLHAILGGIWLDAGKDAFPTDSWVSDLKGREPLSNGDYYLFNRAGIVQAAAPTPAIPPDYTIDARGYGMAWIWRGDRLLESGYRFEAAQP